MIGFKIFDGFGTGKGAKVTEEGNLNVVVHPHPPFGETKVALPYRQKFADSSGVTNMNVDGSVTEQEFYIQAEQARDVHVNSLSIRIADGGTPTLNKFGSIAELTNGIKWEWVTSDLGVVELHEGITTNLEMVRTGHKTSAIGTGTDAYLADVSGGGSDKAYLPIIDISEQFGMPWGMKLRKGTEDKMVFTVRDDLTAVSIVDIIAYGIQF